MPKPTTFIFAGGGTGGHLFPGIAIATELRNRLGSSQIAFVGSEREIESKIIAEHGLEHVTLPVEPLPALKKKPLRFVWKNWQAMRSASRLLQKRQPQAVIGLGGYASAPLVWAAYRRGVPVILLEQNVIPGRTTRLLSRFARHVCVSFEEAFAQLPHARSVVVTGNPVRTEIIELYTRASQDAAPIHVSPTKPCLLILGGSLGADSLNEAVLNVIDQAKELLVEWQIVHQTGPRFANRAQQTYSKAGLSAVVEPFFHDLPTKYAQATIVVSRAGATTLAELACVGVPMILLPYPLAMDDHQQANADVFAAQSAAVVVRHGPNMMGTATELFEALTDLVRSPQRRVALGTAAKHFARPNATNHIVELILNSTAH